MQPKNAYEGLIFARAAPDLLSPQGLLVNAEVAKQQLAAVAAPTASTPFAPNGGLAPRATTAAGPEATAPSPSAPAKLHRFYGSVEIDPMNRPVEVFENILNSVVMELLRSPRAKVKLTLEIEAEAASDFDEGDVGVVRDNTKQLKFNPRSTGFSD